MAQTTQLRSFDTVENEAQRVFKLQREAYGRHPYPSLEERLENLRKLDRLLVNNRAAIADAISADFGHRAHEETMVAELFTSVDGIRDVRKKLEKWMAPQKRDVSVLFATGKNRVIPMPKGVVGIVSPWNYPLFLTISPLTSVLAAGNRAMIKMASNSRRLCELLADKFREAFAEDAVAILPGVRAQDFSTLPFDHLIFTGSADAGRNVMNARPRPDSGDARARRQVATISCAGLRHRGGRAPHPLREFPKCWHDLPHARLRDGARGQARRVRRGGEADHAGAYPESARRSTRP